MRPVWMHCIAFAVVLIVLPIGQVFAERSAEAIEKDIKNQLAATESAPASGSSDCADTTAPPATQAGASSDWRGRLSRSHPAISQMDKLQNDMQPLSDQAKQAAQTAENARHELASLEGQPSANAQQIMQAWRDLREAKREQAEAEQGLMPLRAQFSLWERRAQEAASRCP